MPIIRIKNPLGPSRVPKAGKSLKAPKKAPKKTPNKPPKRRRASSSSLSSSSLNLSDEDGYSAVEDVSDSEDDDEEHVFAAEEEHIISHELHQKRSAVPSSPRPISNIIEYDQDNAADADDDDDSEDDEGENLFGSIEEEEAEDSGSVSWNGFTSENDEIVPAEISANEQAETPVERHVRFAGVPDSDSDSDETEEDIDDFFPDIFVSKDNLDSNFRREVEQDDDDDSSTSATYWDFAGAGIVEEDSDEEAYHMQVDDMSQPLALQDDIFGPNSVDGANGAALSLVPGAPSPEEDEDEEDEESEGYESDGDTTEEDEPQLIRKKPVPIQRSESEEPSDSEEVDATIKFERGKPRVGRFNIRSSSKPICVLNPKTRKMMIIAPQNQRRLDLSPIQFPSDCLPLQTTTQSSPIIGNPGSLMLSAMFSTSLFDGAMASQTIGPAEAFFPLNSDAVGGEDSEDSFVVDGGEEDAYERNLKIDDFITFDDEDSDGVHADEKSDDGDTEAAETPSRRPSTAPSATSDTNADVHPLLSHLTNNADAVGAFRRNQVNQQLIMKGQATQESLAFSNPYYHGTLRGIKHGSLGGAATPLTPERRHKKAFAKSPSEAVLQKRKASSMAGDNSHVHKRQRSIPDVKSMHV